MCYSSHSVTYQWHAEKAVSSLCTSDIFDFFCKLFWLSIESVFSSVLMPPLIILSFFLTFKCHFPQNQGCNTGKNKPNSKALVVDECRSSTCMNWSKHPTLPLVLNLWVSMKLERCITAFSTQKVSCVEETAPGTHHMPQIILSSVKFELVHLCRLTKTRG